MSKYGWSLLSVLVLAMGCSQQPYRVFAVQVAGPLPAAAPNAAGARAPAGRMATVGLGLQAAPAVKAERERTAPWDLNQVSAAALATLPGIDAATVQAILAHRPYRSKRELLTQHVLTAAEYARWKGDLAVHRSDTQGRRAKP